MKNKLLFMFSAIIVFASVIFTAGCGTTARGPGFQPAYEIPEGKALVYLYKAKVWGKDMYRIKINGERITTLRRGGYYPYIATPGTVEIVAKDLPRFTALLIPLVTPEVKYILTVEENKIYYIKASSGMANVELQEVPEEIGTREIRKCKLLPPYEP